MNAEPSSAESRLAALGIALPEAPKPVAAYVPAVRAGNLLFVSGQLPFAGGKIPKPGAVGEALTLDEGRAAARQACLNALAVVRAELGSLDRVKRIVKVTGFVAAPPSFTDYPKVVNGASDLLAEIFGEKGRHARAAVGAPSLPLGAPVEIELIVEAAG